jgi:predicted P-loop ATPase/GTPase
MTLLVAGAERVDAGKTTFATGLLAHTGAVGFKPRAGNDFWYDHDDCRRALDEGRLYGKDAKRLAAASPGHLTPEAINPVHRLWRPAPGGGTGLLGQDDREFLLDRVGEEFVVNGTVDLPPRVRESLDLDGATVVESLPALNEAMVQRHLPTLDAIIDDIAAADRAVVESYADIARPTAEPVPDAVAVVEPGRVRLYDGERFARACEVAPGDHGDGLLEQRVGRVADMLDPAETYEHRPLPGDAQSDPAAVADAYEPAYDRLLALASR